MLIKLNMISRLLRREWKTSEWMIILFSVVLSVTAFTAIEQYIQRLSLGFSQQAAYFLGGNMAISSSTQIPDDWIKEAKLRQLQTAQVWTYPTVVSKGDQLQLVNLQAVSHEYPIVGKANLKIIPGHLWAEPRLMSLLNLHLNDKVKIGSLELKVTTILEPDIDSLNSGIVFAPRAMISLEDAIKTGTVITGSRVDFRLLIAGDATKIDAYRKWLTTKLKTNQKIIDINNQQLASREIMMKATTYLQMILALIMGLAGISIYLSAKQYINRHRMNVAVYRCFGATSKDILLIYLSKIILIGIIASIIGVILGDTLQSIISTFFSDIVKINLPPSSWLTTIKSGTLGIILLIGFSLPSVIQLTTISPMAVWRSAPLHNQNYAIQWIFPTISIIIILLINELYSIEALKFLSWVTISISVLYATSIFIITYLKSLIKYFNGYLRTGLSQIIYFPHIFSMQFVCFTLILSSALLAHSIKSSLVVDWQKSLSDKTPNYFLINIAKNDIEELLTTFRENQIETNGVYPIVRGRMTAINNKPIMEAVPPQSRLHNALHRDLNLSEMWDYPSDNKIVEGRAWSTKDSGSTVVSIENDMANQLNIKIGDKLSFVIMDKIIEAVVINKRSLVWTSINPNFYVIFPPGTLTSYEASYITSIHLNQKNRYILNDLIKKFPNMTIIDISSIFNHLQFMMGYIISAMEILLMIMFLLAGLILILGIKSTTDERKKFHQLLKIIGADRYYLHKASLIEIISYACMIGVTAVMVSTIAQYLIKIYLFNM